MGKMISQIIAAINAGTAGAIAALLPVDLISAFLGVYNVKLYGAKADDSTDNSAAFAAAVAAWQAGGSKGQVYFPGGTYRYSTTPNWGIKNFRGVGSGEQCTILKYTGSGHCLDFDDPTTNNTSGIEFLDISVRGNGAAAIGIFIRSIHHSNFDVEVRDVSGAAMETHFAVDTDITLRCSQHDGAFAVTPTNGIILDKRNAGEQTTNSKLRVVIEGVTGDGVVANEALGVEMLGTSEGNGGRGAYFGANSAANRTSLDCETNVGDDFTDDGVGNIFFGVVSAKPGAAAGSGLFRARNATGCSLIGGRFNRIRLESTSKLNKVYAPGYNTDGSGSFFNAAADTEWFGAPINLWTPDNSMVAYTKLGHVVFADLGGEIGGVAYYCTDADTPATPGAVATSSGDKAGAMVVRIRGAWHAF